MAGQKKRTQFAIGSLVVLGALVYLVNNGMKGTMVYYLTVSELKAKEIEDSLYDKGVRVSGKVVNDSIEWNSMARELKFEIAEGTMALPVFYRGTFPDMFKDGADVIVEGKYTRKGTFFATTLLTSCPSKYEPADKNGDHPAANNLPASDI